MVVQPCQFQIGGAEINLAGNDFQSGKNGGFDFIQQASLAEQYLVGTCAGDLFHADAAGGIGLRVQVKKQHALTDGGKAGGQIDGSGGFSHASLLIGNGNDFGWH